MAYTARGLIDQARSLADLESTKFISYTDELNLINEAYRDIYSRYIESMGDYWVTEVVISIDSTMLDPNSNGQGYLVPFPTDFYKLRTISWQSGNGWIPMDPFSMSNRDHIGWAPQYRIKNSTIWIVGQGVSQIKVEYYPTIPLITAPDSSITLASGEAQYNFEKIGASYYDITNNVYFYIYNSKTIKCQDLNTGVTSTLYVSTNNVDCLFYNAGWVYYRDTADERIYRATTDFTSTLVPASTVFSGVKNFLVQNSGMYVNTATQTLRYSLDGGSSSVVQSVASVNDYQLLVDGTTPMWIVGGFLVVSGVTSTIPATAITNDGTYIYVLNSSNQLKRISISSAFAATVVETMETGALVIGDNFPNTILPVVSDVAIGLSVPVDYSFDFPVNEVNELMAYQSALSYARKQNDQLRMADLANRITELWNRFWSVNKRDEYKNVRINNDYQYGNGSGIGNW